jgi:ketosteroid isomerase-like protein
MSDLEDFLAHTLQRHAQATTGVRNGDATLLIEMLSTRAPVTLFPAAQPAKRGWAEVSQAFQRVASPYSNSPPVTFDLVAAGVSGDLAYVVGNERGSASVGGGPVEPVDLRVTQVYRREDDEWKLVHRSQPSNSPIQTLQRPRGSGRPRAPGRRPRTARTRRRSCSARAGTRAAPGQRRRGGRQRGGRRCG